MKKTIVIALVCVNVALLAWLVTMAMPTAEAQAYRGGNNYVMVTGQMDANYDAVFVLDLTKRRMAAFRLDQTTKKLVAFGARDLSKDFRGR